MTPPLSRRAFLRRGTATAGLVGLIRLRPAVGAVPSATQGWLFLDDDRADLLSAIAERMVFTGDAAMPSFRETRAIEVVDAALWQADDVVQEQLDWLLWAFEYGPPIFDLRWATFRGLDDAGRDGYIRGWAESRFGLRRMGFQALKNLSMLGYYSQDATWGGIHYDGPWTGARGAAAGGEAAAQGER